MAAVKAIRATKSIMSAKSFPIGTIINVKKGVGKQVIQTKNGVIKWQKVRVAAEQPEPESADTTYLDKLAELTQSLSLSPRLEIQTQITPPRFIEIPTTPEVPVLKAPKAIQAQQALQALQATQTKAKAKLTKSKLKLLLPAEFKIGENQRYVATTYPTRNLKRASINKLIELAKVRLIDVNLDSNVVASAPAARLALEALIEIWIRFGIDRMNWEDESRTEDRHFAEIALMDPAVFACINSYTDDAENIFRPIFNAAIFLVTPHDKEFVVWRGISANVNRPLAQLLEAHTIGKEAQFRSIASTSLDVNVAVEFSSDSGNLILLLIVPPSYPAIFVRQFATRGFESEVVLPALTRYRVEDIRSFAVPKIGKFDDKTGEDIPPRYGEDTEGPIYRFTVHVCRVLLPAPTPSSDPTNWATCIRTQ